MLHKNSLNNCYNIDYLKENESCASTNKDSYMTSSLKGNNSYNLFRNKNNLKNAKSAYYEEKKEKSNNFAIQDYMSKNTYKCKKKETNKNYTSAKNNYYRNSSSKFNNFYKSNYHKNSIINRTMKVLSLQKAIVNSDISMLDTDRYFLINYNNKNKIKEIKKKKLKEKCNKTQLLKENKKYNHKNCNNKGSMKHNNNTSVKSDFNNEQKKLELIKKQYIKSMKKSQIIFHDIKEKMNNITYYQNSILEFNDKCLKYSTLSQEDNLKKYKEENNKNLKDFKSKKNRTIYRRPLSCGNEKVENKNIKKIKKKLLNSQAINIKEKRENDINCKIDKIKNYNTITNKCCNRLRFYNALLDMNNDKKTNFYNYLKQKFKNNSIMKKRYYSHNISCL